MLHFGIRSQVCNVCKPCWRIVVCRGVTAKPTQGFSESICDGGRTRDFFYYIIAPTFADRCETKKKANKPLKIDFSTRRKFQRGLNVNFSKFEQSSKNSSRRLKKELLWSDHWFRIISLLFSRFLCLRVLYAERWPWYELEKFNCWNKRRFQSEFPTRSGIRLVCCVFVKLKCLSNNEPGEIRIRRIRRKNRIPRAEWVALKKTSRYYPAAELHQIGYGTKISTLKRLRNWTKFDSYQTSHQTSLWVYICTLLLLLYNRRCLYSTDLSSFVTT